MKRLTAVILSLLSLPSLHAAQPSPESKPNIILILADDLGWSDLNCYGNRFHETPNIDRLAQRGMRFKNFHTASPVCSPTRASILTGMYAERLGMTQPAAHIELVSTKAFLPKADLPAHKVVEPKSTTRLDTTFFTLGKALQAEGYLTAHYGKWHLGLAPYVPVNHGFEIDVPNWQGHGPNGTYLGPSKYGPGFVLAKGEHLEDRMAQEAVDFLKKPKDRPFFLNYWAFSVHSPFVAKPELIKKYRAKAQSLPPDAPHRNPVYAAMIQSLDEAVGRILDTLEETGLADRTIIIFSSDNGAEVGSIRGAGQEQWSNSPRDLLDIPLTSNTPYRGGKGSLHEGGTRVPCIVVWPGRVSPGSVSDAMFSSVDFFPTMLEMIGAPQPPTPIDGISQVPALLGRPAPRNFLYGYWPNYPPERLKNREGAPGAWIQHAGYKLVRYFNDGPEMVDRLELFNLDADPGERNNLADKEPERVAELLAEMKKHHANTGTLIPFPNPNYRADAGFYSGDN